MNELKNFPNINIKYHRDINILIIKCVNILDQLEDLKKILKILIFKIQSKEIKNDSIVIEFIDKDFMNNNIIKLLNVMKFTKTSHYFNIIIRKKFLTRNALDDRINFILNKYSGLNINKKISFLGGTSYERI